MATETNVYDIYMATGLLENYLVGKRVVELTGGDLSFYLDDVLIEAVGKTEGEDEICMYLAGTGTVFFDQARIVTVDD